MPIQRYERENVPYVRPAYEPDTRTLAQLMAMAGQARAADAGRRGQVRGQGWMTLGQIISSGIQDIENRKAEQARAEAAAALKREEMNKPIAVGGSLVRPMSGEVVYSAPEKREGFSLSPGQRRYDETGKEIASAPEPVKPQEGFSLSPGQRRFDASGNQIASVDPVEAREPNVTRDQLAWLAENGKDDLTRSAAARALKRIEALNPRPASDGEPLVQIVGPDGKAVYAPRSQAVGKQPPSGSQKPATGLEKRALNFYNRASQADIDLEGLEPQIQQMGLGGQTYMEFAPNFLQSELGQQYTQAQRAFTEARLRKDSGAAIPEQEFANDRKTYFAQPGDSKDTLEQKRRARAAVLASLGFESGQALGEYLGDTDEAARVVQSYRTRSQKPSGAALKIKMKAPDGSVQDVDPSMVDHYKRLGATVVK